jgi:hypothetical protein
MKEQKKWFEVSLDELESRTIRHEIMHNQPITRANAMVFNALDKVFALLGVDLAGGIKAQQVLLGIDVVPLDEQWPEKVRGLVVSKKGGDGVPVSYAWVSQAKIEKSGDIFCEVHLFEKNIRWEFHCDVNITKVEG